MANLTLTSLPRLSGYTRDFGTTSLREMTEISLTSLAMPVGGKTKFAAVIKSSFGVTLATPMMSKLTKNAKTRLVQTQPDQFFCLSQSPKKPSKALLDAAYLTDQTDGWVALEMDGPDARAALARICPIDLDAKVFPLNASARTSMEHLGVLIIRTGKDQFALLSASSSAESFLHALELSLKNVT